MSLTHPPPRQAKANLPLGREELAFITLAGSLPPGVYDQSLPTHAQMEAWPPSIQMEQQPIVSLFEAQPHDTRKHCASCNKDFGRPQELKRHFKDVHMPRCRCPFCNYTWTRPNQIKAHLMADHIDKFTAEMLDEFKDMCGQRIIEFVNAYHSGRHIEATHAIPGPGQVPVDPIQFYCTGVFPSGADHVLRHPETLQPPMSWHFATPSTHQELVAFYESPTLPHPITSLNPVHPTTIYYV